MDPDPAYKARYDLIDRALGIALAAQHGLIGAVKLAESFPTGPEDVLGEDLLRRLRGCVETLDGEIAHYRALGAGSQPPAMAAVLRLVPA